LPIDPTHLLKLELEQLKRDFFSKTSKLEMRIVELEKGKAPNAEVELASHQPSPIEAKLASHQPSPIEVNESHQPSPLEVELDSLQPIPHENNAIPHSTLKAFKTPTRTTISSPKPIPPEASFRFFAFLWSLLGPFGELVEQYVKAYGDYKKQGKGPVFLMTSAGVVILTFGFIYLLQYSFNNLLNATGRVALGYGISAAVMGLGYRLSKNQSKNLDYGSALLGCGVTLMYVSTFFAHSWYALISSGQAFLALALTTGFSLFLSFRFHTRIVSVLSLLGGALTPLLIPEPSDSSHLYLYYVSLLGWSGLWLSYRISWPGLTHLWLILLAGVLETLFRTPHFNEWVTCHDFIIMTHLAFYGFFAYTWKSLRRAQDQANPHIVFTLVGSLCLTLASLYRSYPPYLGWCFALNGGLFLLVFIGVCHQKNWSTLTKKCYQSLSASLAVVWLGCAIFVLSTPDCLGMLWCGEALFLLFLGFSYQLVMVRKEAWSLLTLASIQVLFEIGPWIIPLFNDTSLFTPELIVQNEGATLLSFGAILFSSIAICKRFNNRCETWENNFHNILMDLAALWFAVTFYWMSACFWHEGALLLSIIPMFVLLYWAKKTERPIIETLAVLHFPLILLQLLLSGQEVHNFHFEAQTLVGKIARIESFATLWALAFFYRKFYRHGAFLPMAELMHHLFYLLIPIFWLPGPIRHLTPWTGMWLWLAWSIALLLYAWKGLNSLLVEFCILSAIAGLFSIAAVWAVGIKMPLHSLEALITGAILYGILFQLQRSQKWARFEIFKQHSIFSQLYWGIALASSGYLLFNSLTLSSLIFISWSLAILLFHPKAPSISPCIGLYASLPELICIFNLLHFYLGTAFLPQHSEEKTKVLAIGSGLSLMAWGYLLHGTNKRTEDFQKLMHHSQRCLWFFNGALALFYSFSLYIWLPEVSKIVTSMALVIHATILLLLSIRPLYARAIKLSPALYLIAAIKILYFDLAGYSLAQKVIAFMLIGVLLLLGAWIYQRMTHTTHAQTDQVT
jgi:hypothetical protein